MLSTTMERAEGPAGLAGRWRQFRAENPKVRIRDAARALGTAEAALVATGCGDTAVRLRRDWAELLKALPQVGRVMALTRNEACVHERHGRYEDVSVTGIMGLVLGPDIDLRIFLSSWKHAFAVTERTAQGDRRSVQVFDAAGVAVHKVYATSETDEVAFTALTDRFRAEDQSPSIALDAEPAAKVPLPDADIDVAALRDTWSKLEDTHDFFGMLRRLKVDRLQALRLAGPEFARPLAVTAARSVLERASAQSLPIMIFVGNRGCIQIHTGPVKRLVTRARGSTCSTRTSTCICARTRSSAPGWCASRRATAIVTSLEIFDAAGDCDRACCSASASPASRKTSTWRALADGLRRERVVVRLLSCFAAALLIFSGSCRAPRPSAWFRRRGRSRRSSMRWAPATAGRGGHDQRPSALALSLPKIGYMRALSSRGHPVDAPDARAGGIRCRPAAGDRPAACRRRAARDGRRSPRRRRRRREDPPGRGGAADAGPGRAARAFGRRHVRGDRQGRGRGAAAAAGPVRDERRPRRADGGRAGHRRRCHHQAGRRRERVRGYTGYKPLSAEAATNAAPEILLAMAQTVEQAGGPAAFMAQLQLGATPAGRDNRLVALDGHLPARLRAARARWRWRTWRGRCIRAWRCRDDGGAARPRPCNGDPAAPRRSRASLRCLPPSSSRMWRSGR